MTRVLVVDDEVLIAFDIRDTLLGGGFGEVDLAADVQSALSCLDRCSYDLAVLDGNLNGDTAEPVAMALRARGTPFMVVSGYSGEQRSGALATARFLGKPFAPDELLAAARATLAK